LYLMSIASIAVYGIVLAGWSSNNKYAMLGGLRSSAQMISYELTLGLSFVTAIILADSMRMHDIVEAQKGLWFVVVQPVGAVIFWIATLAEVNRAPFDMPEAESELVSGFCTEYSSMKYALFFMAEYANMIVIAAITSTLFLGGWSGPLPQAFGVVNILGKVIAIMFFFIWLRATLPRVRYDQLMQLGWKILIPLALANLAVTGVVVILQQ